MSIAYQPVLAALESVCKASGKFRAVNGHEPKNAPEKGLTAAVWVDGIQPTTRSGLAATSVVVVYLIRLYTPMISEPQDAIDPAIVSAADAVMGAVTADFTLGGAGGIVDLLGSEGTAMGAQAGYVTVGQTMFRCIDITVPVLLDDVWSQSA